MKNYELNILINGRTARKYFHEGNVWIEGREGSNFEIQLSNWTNSKIKAIISVDGLSIIDGEDAGLESQGYVVDPHGCQTFIGWRTSTSTVNKFYFSSRKKSYVKRTDKNPKNIGVIGAMIFNQKPVHNYWNPTLTTNKILLGEHPNKWPYEVWSQTTLYGSGAVDSSLTEVKALSLNSLGVGFGQEVESHAKVDNTTFEENPIDILCIYYDDRKGLEKRGIIVDEYKSMPNPFPTYLTRNKFVKKPTK